MGEEGTARETIACDKLARIDFHVDDNPHDGDSAVHLHSFNADKLICVHSNASGYNNCRYDYNPEEALVNKPKDINGEMSIGF